MSSQIRLSLSVTLVHLITRISLSAILLHHLIAYGLGAVLQAKCMGIKNGRFLTNISLYLGNDRIYGDS